MANEWRLQPLGEVAHVVMGYSPKGDTYNNDSEGVPLLNGPTEFGPHFPRVTIFTTAPSRFSEPGDILFCVRGSTTGRMNWADKKYAVGRGIAAIRAKTNGEDTYFIYCCIQESMQRLLSLTSGSVFPNLSTGDINGFEIPWPEKPIRKSIVHILHTLDDKIELNRQMNRTLEKMAAAIFKSWFVDFDPVRAKVEGQDTGLPKEIADLFPDSFEDSEIGPIPKGWCVKYLPEVIKVNPSRSLPRGTVAPYVPMKEMPTTLSRPTGWWRRKFNSGSKFQNGDVLLARITPCLENGKTAFVDFLDGNEIGWGSTEYIVLRSKVPLLPEFTYCLARSERFREHAIANMTGTSGRQRVPPSCLDRFPVVVSPEDITIAFGKFIQPIFRRTRANDIQSMTLEKLRDRLLPKLLSGEINVSAVMGVAQGAV